MQIYLARNRVQAGPYRLDQLNTMLASGEVALDDLLWHAGMSQWQPVGDVTHGRRVYQPSNELIATDKPPTDTVASSDRTNKSTDSSSKRFRSGKTTGDKKAGKERMTVDQLYGKTPSTEKDTPKTERSVSAKRPIKPVTHQRQETVLASINSRLLSLLINGVLYLLATFPLVWHLSKQHLDFSRFEQMGNIDQAYQYSVTLINSIPDSILWTTQFMVGALFVVQLLMIAKRGQSLGKMVTGIRVIDQTSKRLPSLSKQIGLRTLLLFIIYNILFTLASFLGFALIALNYIMAARSDKNIGWHDKLAHTMVVKANDTQLKKSD